MLNQSVNRRSFLQLAATGAFAGSLLAACGTTAAAPSSPAPSSAAGAASPSTSPSSSAGAAAKTSAKASGKPAASIAPPERPGQLLMSYSELVGTDLPVWGAEEGGIFRKNGLDVGVRLIESSLGVSALLSGEVPLAAMGGSEALAAAANGAHLKVIATLSPRYPYKLEVPASVKSADGLKGKKVGVSRIGSSSDVASRLALRQLGLQPGKDVTIIQVGSLTARMAALSDGAIQGALATPPSTVTLEAKGFHPILDLAKQDLPAAQDCVVVEASWLGEHRTEAQKVIDSLVEATAREKKDKSFATGVLQKYLKVNDKQALDATYDYFVDTLLPALPYPRAQQFKDALAQVSKRKPAAKSFDLSTLLDASFVQSAADRGIDKQIS